MSLAIIWLRNPNLKRSMSHMNEHFERKLAISAGCGDRLLSCSSIECSIFAFSRIFGNFSIILPNDLFLEISFREMCSSNHGRCCFRFVRRKKYRMRFSGKRVPFPVTKIQKKTQSIEFNADYVWYEYSMRWCFLMCTKSYRKLSTLCTTFVVCPMRTLISGEWFTFFLRLTTLLFFSDSTLKKENICSHLY